jgi:Flp pilus assembly protein TadD
MPCLRRDVILSVARSLLAVCCALGQAAPRAPANDAAPAHSPTDAKALHLRALEHAEAGRFEAALADVDAAIEHSPDAALTLGLKGSILMRMERFTDAVATFSRSLAIEPRAQVHFDRGFCHSNLGDFARAIDD